MTGPSAAGASVVRHVGDLMNALHRVTADGGRIEDHGRRLASVLAGGGRLLVAGNGGSAAHAQHLSGELTGRFRSERRPLSAIALHTDSTAFTAIANDYGLEAAFARQVEAHGRPGDVLLGISTSGASRNVIAAADAARRLGLATWAWTGPVPNPLAACCDDGWAVDATSTATVQEVHQVLIHVLCQTVDDEIARHERHADSRKVEA
jgi:D-sedoheptulose 7-phosphate isomerase